MPPAADGDPIDPQRFLAWERSREQPAARDRRGGAGATFLPGVALLDFGQRTQAYPVTPASDANGRITWLDPGGYMLAATSVDARYLTPKPFLCDFQVQQRDGALAVERTFTPRFR